MGQVSDQHKVEEPACAGIELETAVNHCWVEESDWKVQIAEGNSEVEHRLAVD